MKPVLEMLSTRASVPVVPISRTCASISTGSARLAAAFAAGRVFCDAGIDGQSVILLQGRSATSADRTAGGYGASEGETPDRAKPWALLDKALRDGAKCCLLDTGEMRSSAVTGGGGRRRLSFQEQGWVAMRGRAAISVMLMVSAGTAWAQTRPATAPTVRPGTVATPDQPAALDRWRLAPRPPAPAPAQATATPPGPRRAVGARAGCRGAAGDLAGRCGDRAAQPTSRRSARKGSIRATIIGAAGKCAEVGRSRRCLGRGEYRLAVDRP